MSYKNKEQKNENAKLYRELHKDEINARRREWAKLHPDYDKLRCREYRKNHLQEERENAKKYRDEHVEERKAKSKEYYLANRKTIGARLREKTVGISPEQYNLLFEKQNGMCAICGKHQDNLKRALHADHDHVTGKMRELLCSNCNTTLGLMHDSEIVLRKAADYIHFHRVQL